MIAEQGYADVPYILGVMYDKASVARIERERNPGVFDLLPKSARFARDRLQPVTLRRRHS